jgi:hypothetical protein
MKRNLVLASLAVAATLLAAAAPVHAQATRTWVSGVGDDANPCSRTAPCKTFAGAISKTMPAGEINVLDPGGFGAVTITKAITISSEGFEAGVLVSGTNGIIVAAGANDVVVLRGLDIEGLGTGIDGIRFQSGAALHVEKCTINNFTNFAIEFVPAAPSNPSPAVTRLFVKDSIIRENGSGSGGSGSTGGGIVVSPASGFLAQAEVSNTRLERNILGLRSQSGANTKVYNCSADGNLFAGFTASSAGILTVDHSSATHNAQGINCPAGSTVRIGETSASDNGTDVATGGTCQSFKNNDIATAPTPNALTTLALQ